ncbi:hypothetical protein BDK51DRAFT_49815 [Blyttiomyces helicus]|uniref:Uncharacterized protein n=1 Tax=Blyttiomyces helicus TaxID=388810 RepID=A0A4P9WL99_9FUNG|nr:hypothetical protein BDK51DRAFT_49815 [Blyttiomyces helicus]|eukprot:RKO91406.1 hypothetical protein BDK51DRAFT_49815 [Blyttiomyces helicus]
MRLRTPKRFPDISEVRTNQSFRVVSILSSSPTAIRESTHPARQPSPSMSKERLEAAVHYCVAKICEEKEHPENTPEDDVRAERCTGLTLPYPAPTAEASQQITLTPQFIHALSTVVYSQIGQFAPLPPPTVVAGSWPQTSRSPVSSDVFPWRALLSAERKPGKKIAPIAGRCCGIGLRIRGIGSGRDRKGGEAMPRLFPLLHGWFFSTPAPSRQHQRICEIAADLKEAKEKKKTRS